MSSEKLINCLSVMGDFLNNNNYNCNADDVMEILDLLMDWRNDRRVVTRKSKQFFFSILLTNGKEFILLRLNGKLVREEGKVKKGHYYILKQSK